MIKRSTYILIYLFFVSSVCADTLLFDGYENGDLSNWNVQYPSEHDIVTSPVHSGTYAHRATGVGGIVWRNFTPSTTGDLFIRFYWRRASGSGWESKLGRLHPTGNDGDLTMELWGDNGAPGMTWYGNGSGCGSPELAGALDARYPGTWIDSADHWYKYELFIEYNSSAGTADGRVRLWIDRPDSTAFADADLYKASDVQNAEIYSTNCDLRYGSLHLPTGYDNVSGYFYFDDLEILDAMPSVGDSTPPTISAVSVNGTTISITTDETTVWTGYDANDCNLDGQYHTDNGLSSPSGSGTSWTLTAQYPITAGETVNLDCTLGTDDIEDSAGNDMVTFADTNVTNNTAQSPQVSGISGYGVQAR